MDKTDEQMICEWLAKSMVSIEEKKKWPIHERALDQMITYVSCLEDIHLKTLRAFLNSELERREDVRKHPIESLHR